MKMNFAVGMNANERMDEIAGHARVAEESGFDFVTCVDQPCMSRDVFASKLTTGLCHMVGKPEDICEKTSRVRQSGIRTIATVTCPVGDKISDRKGMLRDELRAPHAGALCT